MELDKVWREEAMSHCFALFSEGKNPWGLSPPGDGAEDAFSARVAAWYARTSFSG